ncbi:DUF927 domain-containing protein [Roseixanthobacter liquoris]|uniref:DUF927 domain-containing protein n=1 Tax=Roseixanthobacter liquoris TaxID=3119921 RepID=UPI00372C03C0
MTFDPNEYVRLKTEYIDANTREHFTVLEFRTLTNQRAEAVIARRHLANLGQVHAMLLRNGWSSPHGVGSAVAALRHAIEQVNPPVQMITTRTGFHGQRFVLHDRTLGDHPDDLKFVDLGNSQVGRLAKLGTIEGWREGLREPCSRSSYLTFSVSLAMAAVLLEPTGQNEGMIFQLTGPSASGKTLAQRVAQSAMGLADPTALLSHNITGRALEERLGAANHGLLCLDDTAQIQGTPRAKRDYIAHLPQLLASGKGKVRSERVASEGLSNLEYRAVGLSSGELPLESYGERLDGERARFPDIPVPGVDKGGIFDRLEEGDNSILLATLTESTIAANYGVSYELFVERFVENYEANAARAHALIATFLAKATPSGNSWTRRFATKFALAYAAAVLGFEFGALPFTEKHAMRCILRLHNKARVEARTAEQAKEALLLRLAQKAKTIRFPLIKRGEELSEERATKAWGVRRKREDKVILAVLREHFEALVEPARHFKAVVDLLVADGTLMQGANDRHVMQLQVAGFKRERPCFYCLDIASLPETAEQLQIVQKQTGAKSPKNPLRAGLLNLPTAER